MLKFNIQSKIVVDVLGHTEAVLNDSALMLADMGAYQVTSTQDNFRTSTAPDGSKWQANSETTYIRILGKQHTTKDGKLNKRGINRVQSKRPLIADGNLMADIHYQISGDLLLIGSNRKYAATQQFGAKKGQFGKTKRNAPVPWGDIPARPFLGISVKDEKELQKIAAKHLLP